MLPLLAGAAAGRLPSTGADVDPVQYVWSGNTAAFVGVGICLLLLVAWFKYVGLAPLDEEET